MVRTEIPEELLQDMLYRARLARRSVEPGIVNHEGVDVAELAAYWAERLFAVTHGYGDSLLTNIEKGQLSAVLVEATEYMALDPEGNPDPDFVPVTEALLTFLRPCRPDVR